MEIADWLRGLSLDRYAETFPDAAVLPDVATLRTRRRTAIRYAERP
jgi:hypothetical protein